VPLKEASILALSFPLSMVQIRHKGAFDRRFTDELAQLADAGHGGRLILNDRVDYAAMFGMGAHVGQDDLPAGAAREVLGGTALLGLSTHNEQQLSAAPDELLDYVALGPVFGTRSKENPDPVVGLENLRAWRGRTSLPLVAIGGISLANAAEVAAAGADYFAVISALWPPPYTLKSFGHEIETWLKLLPPRPGPASKRA
jgi:thiamine-phosphate pyrophosphorylase